MLLPKTAALLWCYLLRQWLRMSAFQPQFRRTVNYRRLRDEYHVSSNERVRKIGPIPTFSLRLLCHKKRANFYSNRR